MGSTVSWNFHLPKVRFSCSKHSDISSTLSQRTICFCEITKNEFFFFFFINLVKITFSRLDEYKNIAIVSFLEKKKNALSLRAQKIQNAIFNLTNGNKKKIKIYHIRNDAQCKKQDDDGLHFFRSLGHCCPKKLGNANNFLDQFDDYFQLLFILNKCILCKLNKLINHSQIRNLCNLISYDNKRSYS